MAQIILNSSETSQIIDLVEHMVPGVNLSAIKKMIDGVKVDGKVTLTKTFNKTENVQLTITVNGS
jgi:hypothetical protein